METGSTDPAPGARRIELERETIGMKLVFKNGDYYPRCDFRLEVKWGKAETETAAADVARGIAAALGALAAVRAKINYATVSSVSVAFDPALENDPTSRTVTIEEILGVLDATGAKYAPLPIVDLVTAPYRARHPWRDRDILWAFGPDPVRFARLQALRLPTLAPFLTGSRPVGDLPAFTEFHIGLAADEQALVRYVAKEGSALVGRPCADGCHRSWMETCAAVLIRRGWLVATASQIRAGSKLEGLNQSAGELLAD